MADIQDPIWAVVWTEFTGYAPAVILGETLAGKLRAVSYFERLRLDADDVMAFHPNAHSAIKACAEAKAVERLMREPWQRAIELANFFELRMIAETRHAAATVHKAGE